MTFFTRSSPELVYQQPLRSRLVAAAIGAAMLAVLLLLWPELLGASLTTPQLMLGACLWLALIAAGLRMALSLRSGFVFGADGVGARGAWRTRTLPYDHIAGCTVVPEEIRNRRGPPLRGLRLTFEAMHPGVRPLRLFIAEARPLAPAIIARLKTVPGVSSRQLKLLQQASFDSAETGAPWRIAA
jgi:hypothetical protein